MNPEEIELVRRRRLAKEHRKRVDVFELDPVYAEIKEFSEKSANENYTKKILPTLMDAVHYAYGSAVEGDFAEFGTMTGKTALALGSSIQILNQRFAKKFVGKPVPAPCKKLFLFDSFEGMPELEEGAVDLASTHVKEGSWRPGQCFCLSQAQLTELLKNVISEESFHLIPGWFSDSLSKFRHSTGFSLVHIDCDLYQSTIDVLDALFSKKLINEGCIILFDDFFCDRGSKWRGEYRAWLESVDKWMIDFSHFRNYGPVGTAFIIHRYV